MIKHIFLIGAAAMSAPALAQATDPAPGDVAASPPSQVEPAPAPASDSTTPPGKPARSGAAATPDQVAQIVGQEFPTYDADASGELSEAEFTAWMKNLRTANDPAVDAESPAIKTWIGQAFAAADADKSSGVSKAELTGFLSRGA